MYLPLQSNVMKKNALLYIIFIFIGFGNVHAQCPTPNHSTITLNCGPDMVNIQPLSTIGVSGLTQVKHRYYSTANTITYSEKTATELGMTGYYQSTWSELISANKSYWVTTVNGCESAKKKIDIVVNYSEAPTITPSILPPPTTVCTNTTFYLTSSPGSSYDWRFNTTNTMGTTTISTAQSHTPTESGYYWVLADSGCGTESSVPYFITLEQPLSPGVTISDGGGSYCPGTSRTLTALPTGVDATPSYVWKHGETTISTASTASVTIDQTKTITLTMTSGDDCVDNTTATATTTISMLPYPVDGELEGPTVICESQSAPFVVYGSQDGYLYFLYRNDTVVASLTGTGSNSPPAGFAGQTIAGTYTLKGSNALCSNEKIDMTGSFTLSILQPTVAGISTNNQNPTTFVLMTGFI